MRKAISFVVLAIVLAVSACGGSPQSVEYERTKVNYLTSFNTFGRDAYAYVAQEKGFFDQAGLDVTITPGTGSVDVLKLVAGGRADFGIADFTATAITVAKEKLPVTTVAAVHQKSLAAIVALEGSGISKPADLVGKKIGDQPGSTNQVMFPVYAKAAGIGKVHLHALRHACATHLLKGGADVRHVQAILGHKKLVTTALYTRVVIEDLRGVVAAAHPRERTYQGKEKR